MFRRPTLDNVGLLGTDKIEMLLSIGGPESKSNYDNKVCGFLTQTSCQSFVTILSSYFSKLVHVDTSFGILFKNSSYMRSSLRFVATNE